MRMTILTAGLTVVMSTGVLLGETWTVGDLDSDMFQTVQDAIDAAQSGDIIMIRQGVYTGSGEVVADCTDKAVTLKAMIGLGEVVLDGQNARRCVRIDADDQTVLSGLTIRNGERADSDAMLYGGAVHIASDAFIEVCSFEHNGDGQRSGGAILAAGSAEWIVQACHFENNSAGDGAGIFYAGSGSSSGLVQGCTFDDNEAQRFGGAIWVYGYHSPPPLQVLECTFHGNTAAETGGAVRVCCHGSAEIDSCAFADNDAGERGGAIDFDQGADPDGQVVRDSTFLDCTAGESGGAIECRVFAELADLDIASCSAPEGGGLFLKPYDDILVDTCVVQACQADAGGGIFVVETQSGEVLLRDTRLCGNTVDNIAGPFTDLGGNDVTPKCPSDCPADISGDGIVGTADILMVLSQWGSADPDADANQDGIVNVDDILLIIVNWGPCGG